MFFLFTFANMKQINYSNKLSVSSSSLLEYSSSSEYLSSFSMLPLTTHIFQQYLSHLQNSKHTICDFAHEHVIALHFC